MSARSPSGEIGYDSPYVTTSKYGRGPGTPTNATLHTDDPPDAKAIDRWASAAWVTGPRRPSAASNAAADCSLTCRSRFGPEKNPPFRENSPMRAIMHAESG